jgi:signal transduction histidine kinase
VRIVIPCGFSDLLLEDSALGASVHGLLDQLLPILATPPAFFPEYTEHGADHVQCVLDTCGALVANDAWSALTAEDAGILVVSVLLHDLAMHLSDDDWRQLVAGGTSPADIWAQQWSSFLEEAARFDARTLVSLFGDTSPVRRPPSDPAEFTKRDRLLIGEFIRRHHHELAAQILGGEVLDACADGVESSMLGAERADLAGAIALSHGVSLRNASQALTGRFDAREYRGAHPTFLMALVRISDYLDIEPERAGAGAMRVRAIRSPTSRLETRLHQAVRDIRYTHDDPEALFLQAHPQDVETYLRLARWLREAQDELDTAWAVLGETYGRLPDHSSLGFALRRLRSNLDDIDAFAATVHYIPCQASFEAANPDLLKLMIGPLYGYAPRFGVRELVQNSVDAVRELQYLQSAGLVSRTLAHKDLSADVEVSIEAGAGGAVVLRVDDRGIGMTADVVRDYFLRAGASYRKSSSWRQAFETESGTASIARSGRFGIGSLAMFLLGDDVRVSTRHALAAPDAGVEFTATVDSETIELRRVDRPVGTTVVVRLSESARAALMMSKSWDWYCLTSPSVARFDARKKDSAEGLPAAYQVPLPAEPELRGWHRIKCPGFADVCWTYASVPGLVVNGLIVHDNPEEAPVALGHRKRLAQHVLPRRSLYVPSISVSDTNGLLPLNLQRTAIRSNETLFAAEILASVKRDWLAFALQEAPDLEAPIEKVIAWCLHGEYPGLFSEGQGGPRGVSTGGPLWVAGRDWFTPCDPALVMRSGMERLLILPIRTAKPALPRFFARHLALPGSSIGVVFFEVTSWSGLSALGPLLRLLTYEPGYYANGLAELPLAARGVCVGRAYEEHILKLRRGVRPAFKKLPLNGSEHIFRLESGGLSADGAALLDEAVHELGGPETAVAVWELAREAPGVNTRYALSQYWAEQLPDLRMPWKRCQRQQGLAKPEELRPYFQHHGREP